ncbi:MAG: putative signaling protein [Candidatus Dichloromethanomonas elyunquensis]|nr:MAG: putative signaling protein [Candidatus Dichloromethanomonas elyunquensis]
MEAAFSFEYNQKNEIERILANKAVTSHFQPIVRLADGEIIGYESLSRGPEGSPLYSPIELLRVAEQENKLWELELLFRKNALEKSWELAQDKLLFINVDPNIINDVNFRKGFTREYLLEYGRSPKSVVIEITERTAIQDYKQFKQILKHYTDQGYMIAIDDVGSGYSGLNTINEVRPHFIKMDMDLIRNVDRDPFKQSMVKALVDISNNTSIRLIAEGIETPEELKTLIRLGVTGGQGFLLQRPVTHFAALSDEIKTLVNRYNKMANNLKTYSKDYHYVLDLIKTGKAFSLREECAAIKEYFDTTACSGVCITDNDYPVGLVMKNKLDSQMAKQFGYSLYSKRPVSIVMDRNPLIVDYYTPVYQVASRAMAREEESIYDDIIITKGSKYAGIVPMKKIIEYTLNYEKNYARELNPLTSLPGNTIINRVIKDTISHGGKQCIYYLDLDNFKVYNDVYGFENGDKVIKFTADILQNSVKALFPYNSFVGHIGGDDFIFIVESNPDNYPLICQEIIAEFDKEVFSCFSESHKQQGYMDAEDRMGNKQQYSLTSISIVGVYGELYKFSTPEILAQHMTQLKKEAKKAPYSYYIIKNVDTVLGKI